MERKKEVGESVVSKNLYRLLGDDGKWFHNLELIEEKLGIKESTVRNWISGERNPSLDNLLSVCELFGWDIGEIFIDQDKYINIAELTDKQKELIAIIMRIQDPYVLNLLKDTAGLAFRK